MSELILTKENFEQEVLKSDRAVLVDFWAPWCGPCKMMGPAVEELADELEGQVVVGKVNVDDEDELALKYRIMSIPAFKVFKDGNIVSSAVGIQSREKLMRMLGLAE